MQKSVLNTFQEASTYLFIPLLIFAVACNRGDLHPRKGEKQDNAATGESHNELFAEIHRDLYENPSSARARAEEVLRENKTGDHITEINMLKYIGSSYAFETNYSEAITYYNEALKTAEETELYLEIANINNNLGVIYNEIGNYKNAYIHLTEALNNFDRASDHEKKTGAYNNIGLIYLNLKNYEKALDYFGRALETGSHPEDSILTVSVLNNMALCYMQENQPERSLEYLGQAIALSEKISNNYGLCISFQLKGNLYLGLDDAGKAMEAFTVSTDIASKANLSYQLAIARLGIARVMLRMNQPSGASDIAGEVMLLAGEQNSLVLKSEAHEVLSDIYEKTGDFKNALFHYREHQNAQQEVINQAVVHQVYDVELNYLSQLTKMQQLELEKKELAISKKNNLLFFISLTFVLLLTGLYLIYLNHRHRQKVKLQKTVIELTEKKSNAALEAEIQERKRIGRELHDSLGHLLSLAGLHASMLKKRSDLAPEKRGELLDSLMKTIDDAFDEVRNISHNLAPSLLSERGLKGALKSIADRVNQSSGLTMSYDLYGIDGKLDTLIENTLYRTIQEIVNNTLKHSEASRLFVQLTQGEGELSLITEDNGKGFKPEEVSKHSSYGLTHMKSRIENLKGTMFIDSTPGRGTIISILIPLSK